MSEFSGRTIRGEAPSRGNAQAETGESLEYSDVSRDGPVKAFGQEDLVGGEIGWHFPLHWRPRAGVSTPLLAQKACIWEQPRKSGP